MSDERCNVCGEPRSAHVPTEKGPLTHPREARGEGVYRYAGTRYDWSMYGNPDHHGGLVNVYEFVRSDNEGEP